MFPILQVLCVNFLYCKFLYFNEHSWCQSFELFGGFCPRFGVWCAGKADSPTLPVLNLLPSQLKQ